MSGVYPHGVHHTIFYYVPPRPDQVAIQAYSKLISASLWVIATGTHNLETADILDFAAAIQNGGTA